MVNLRYDYILVILDLDLWPWDQGAKLDGSAHGCALEGQSLISFSSQLHIQHYAKLPSPEVNVYVLHIHTLEVHHRKNGSIWQKGVKDTAWNATQSAQRQELIED